MKPAVRKVRTYERALRRVLRGLEGWGGERGSEACFAIDQAIHRLGMLELQEERE